MAKAEAQAFEDAVTKIMKDAKRVIAFDCETSGLKAQDERILELGYVLYEDGEEKAGKVIRFKPDKSIAPEASKVNGIYEKDLVNEKPFKEYAKELREIFTDDTVYLGYNVNFDIDFLNEEFKRNGEKEFNKKKLVIIDPYEIWRNKNLKQKLEHAYQTFVGGKFDNAHSALPDIYATIKVLGAMVTRFQIDHTLSAVASATRPDVEPDQNKEESKYVVAGSNQLIWGDKGQMVLNFTVKSKGSDLDKLDTGMLQWLVDRDFVNTEVKKYVQMVLDGKKLPAKGK